MSLWNSTFKNPGKPMQRKTALRAAKPMQRSSKRKHKTEGHHDQKMLDACRGQSCYLLVPGVCPRIPKDPTVVDCHGNWADTGKGMGLKAQDKYSVPGCAGCHYWLDFGTTATREEKRAVFFDALRRWEPVRAAILDESDKCNLALVQNTFPHRQATMDSSARIQEVA
ncbi:DUF1364 family protein [Pusillimonas caeni]|uniref:nuclease domain-containing protein n=1 Tax=Pusillimonas caeni TaxID=1348472 RepID=UPI000E59E41A|nr:nuclease domain-containing protein [Pusillimonas caeni]TFL14196.1 DUF1364 family protein [Pusillimonas caeni]